MNVNTFPTEFVAVDMGIGDATGNQTGIDIKEFIGKLKIVVNTDATTGTFSIQQSDAPTTGFAAFDPAKAVAAGAGLTELEIDTRATKRYIRAVAGGTMNGAFSIVAIGRKQVTA